MNIKDYFDKLKKISKDFNLDLLVLFGSRVKNSNSKSTDIDIAYYSKIKIDEKELAYKIIKAINYDNIDLVEINEQNSVELNWNIFKQGIKIYENKQGTFDNLLNQFFIDFIDFKEYIDIKNEILNNRLNNIDTKNFNQKLSI